MTDYSPQQLPDEFHEQPLSARMLDDFGICPRKFLLSFFTSRDAERHFRGGTAALHQAVRAAVLEWWALGGPAQVSAQAMQDSFEANWDGSLCADSLEEQRLHAQGRKILLDYHTRTVTRQTEAHATDVRMTGQIGEQTFVAVADLLLSPEPGQVSFVRLTTSRSPLGPTQLAKDVSARLLWLLAQEHPLQGAVDRRVVYEALRKPAEHEVLLTPDEEQHARRDIASRVARIHRETAFEPSKGKQCRWCRSRARCPAWPR
ncbi:MAG: PD-(D/E)XK nuclease family protein [Armatimonadota bacterium]